MHQDKQQKVLEAAKEKFEQFGFKKTNVDEIAAGAGVSKRTLYEMFESKEKVLSELVMAEFILMREIILSNLKGIDDPLEQIRTFVIISKDYFDKNPFLSKVLCDESGLYEPFLQNEISLFEKEVEELFAKILQEGIKKGIFREMDIKGVANCIFILYKSFTYSNKLKLNKAWVQFIANAIKK